MGSWTAEDPRIAPPRAVMTDRAGRWVCEHVGRLRRTVAEVARELGCDWHTVHDAGMAYGAPLVEDAPASAPQMSVGMAVPASSGERLFYLRSVLKESRLAILLSRTSHRAHVKREPRGA